MTVRRAATLADAWVPGPDRGHAQAAGAGGLPTTRRWPSCGRGRLGRCRGPSPGAGRGHRGAGGRTGTRPGRAAPDGRLPRGVRWRHLEAPAHRRRGPDPPTTGSRKTGRTRSMIGSPSPGSGPPDLPGAAGHRPSHLPAVLPGHAPLPHHVRDQAARGRGDAGVPLITRRDRAAPPNAETRASAPNECAQRMSGPLGRRVRGRSSREVHQQATEVPFGGRPSRHGHATANEGMSRRSEELSWAYPPGWRVPVPGRYRMRQSGTLGGPGGEGRGSAATSTRGVGLGGDAEHLPDLVGHAGAPGRRPSKMAPPMV